MKLFPVLSFVLLLAVYTGSASALVTITAYPDSEYTKPSEVFGQGAIYFSATDSSHCCTELAASVENNLAVENITVWLNDNGIAPDNRAGDGFYYGVFWTGLNSTDAAKKYIYSDTGKALKISVSFSPISAGNKSLTTEFTRPTSPILNASFRDNAVYLSWTESSDQSGIEYYLLYRHTEPIDEGNFRKFSSTLLHGRNYTDRTLEDGKTYYYAVAAVDRVKTYGHLSNLANVSTPDVTTPRQITDLSLYQYAGKIYLNWTAPADNVGVEKYIVFKEKKMISSTKILFPYANTTGIYFTDSDIAHNDWLYYAVSAVDRNGNIAEPSNNTFVSVDKLPPGRVTDLAAAKKANGEVYLNWSPVESASKYKVYYSVYPITSSAGLGFSETTETYFSEFPSEPRYYAVSAADDYGNEADMSNRIFAEPDSTAPNAPADLAAEPHPNGTVTINWKPSGSADTAHYRVFRSDTFLTETKNTEYSDSNVPEGYHTYSVIPVDASGNAGRAATSSVYAKDTEVRLSVYHPGRELSVSQAQMAVFGFADQDSALSIENNGVSYGFVRGPDGNFTGYVNLTDGRNIVRVTAKDPAGNAKTFEATVTNKYVQPSYDMGGMMAKYTGKNITFDEKFYDTFFPSDPSIYSSDIFSGLVSLRNVDVLILAAAAILIVVIVLFSNKRTKKEILKLVGVKMQYEYKERNRLIDAAKRYVSSVPAEVLGGVRGKVDGLRVKSAEKDVTVLFADMRNFTHTSMKIGHEKTAQMLNAFYKEISDVVIKYGGAVNDLIGDSVFAVFNLEKECKNHLGNALKASQDMHSAMGRLSVSGHPRMYIGIGIKTGNVTAGTLGHPDALKYTTTGHVVNIAKRLSSAAKMGETLIDSDTYEKIKSRVDVVKMLPLKIESTVIDVFKVLSVR